MLSFLRCIAVCFLLFAPKLGSSQSISELIERGKEYYGQDELDSARHSYYQAFESTDPDIQLQAIRGLIVVATLVADIAEADSLIQVGDVFKGRSGVSQHSWLSYQLIKGEFFRQNSQFEQALTQHKEVAQASKQATALNLIQAEALFYTGLTFERLAIYDSSLIYVKNAYELYKTELDTTSLKFSSIYNGMAVCYYRANQLDEAKHFYLKSKAIAEDKLGPVSRDLAIALNNLSSISRAEENYEEAIKYSERALNIYQMLDDESGMSGAYYSLGVYHYFTGDYGRAKDYMQTCIDIRERLFESTHYSLIGPYEVLGITYEESGNYEMTLKHLARVRKNISANYGTGSIPQGYNYENTAIAFSEMNQLDSALFYIQRANQILPSKLPKDDYSAATHFFTYANIFYRRGELNKALEKLALSTSICQILEMEGSTDYAQNLTLKGLILAEQQKWDLAEEQFSQALEIIRDKSSKGKNEYMLSPNSLTILEDYTDFLFQRYQITGNKNYLEDFEKFSEIYLQLSDKFRKQFIDPYTKSILIKENAAVYDRNIGIYYSLFQENANENYIHTAYKFSEYGRANMLRDLQNEQLQTYGDIPDSVRTREVSLKKEVADLTQMLMEFPDSSELQPLLFQVKEALNKHIGEIAQNYPAYHQLKFNTSIPTITSLQEKLENGKSLLQYMQDDTAYYGLLINAEKVEWLYVGNRIEINEKIKKWKALMMSRERKELKKISKYLYQSLITPFENSIKGVQLTIIPIGALFYLNFETLQKSDAHYLIEDFDISYALSFSVLFSERPQRNAEGVFAVAPGFEAQIKDAYTQSLDSTAYPDKDFLQTIRQPWSLKFVQEITKKFLNYAFTGLEATESNVKANMHKGKVLFFGTHAIANPEDPLRSKLILSKEIGTQSEDGYLHAYELYANPLEAELAVLSACESGLGGLKRGEGMISLAYSLQYAGCPSTVMSLWKVDERINTQIAAEFLRYLHEGSSKSNALRMAKLDYIYKAKAQTKHPFYWGGMVLMGQDGKVDIPGKFPFPLWWLIVGGVVLVLGIWGVSKLKT